MSTENQLENVEYDLPKLGKYKWIFFILLTFSISTIIYFPIVDKVKTVTRNVLKTIPGCAINYQDLKLSFFLPKATLNEVTIPARCAGTKSELVIKELVLNFRLFSFSPFGPHFLIETEAFGNKIEAYLTAGLKKQVINISENVIDLSKIKDVIPQGILLKGKVKLDAMVTIEAQKISDVNLVVDSKDFGFPPMSLMGGLLKLPELNLNTLYLKAEMKSKNKLKVHQFTIGESKTPTAIRSQFKGEMILNQKNIKLTRLNLKGEVGFSKKFREDYALLMNFFSKFNQKDNFYQIKLGGTLAAPKATNP